MLDGCLDGVRPGPCVASAPLRPASTSSPGKARPGSSARPPRRAPLRSRDSRIRSELHTQLERKKDAEGGLVSRRAHRLITPWRCASLMFVSFLWHISPSEHTFSKASTVTDNGYPRS